MHILRDHEFILDFSNILKNLTLDKELDIKTYLETKAYRFFGSEFVLITKKCDYEEAKNICSRLKLAFEELSIKNELDEVAHIGATPFNQIPSSLFCIVFFLCLPSSSYSSPILP